MRGGDPMGFGFWFGRTVVFPRDPSSPPPWRLSPEPVFASVDSNQDLVVPQRFQWNRSLRPPSPPERENDHAICSVTGFGICRPAFDKSKTTIAVPSPGEEGQDEGGRSSHLSLTTPLKMSRNHFYFEPGFRPETAPFLEPAFSFNA